MFEGVYKTAVGNVNFESTHKVFGTWAVIKESNYDFERENHNCEATIGFIVNWTQLKKKKDNDRGQSVSTWSGQLLFNKEDGWKIYTTWALTSKTNKAHLWESTMMSKDTFHKVK